jgi:cytochrome c-type biogenesis protein CcmH/NrfG
MESKTNPPLRVRRVSLLATFSLVALLAIGYPTPGTQSLDFVSQPATRFHSSHDGKVSDGSALGPEEWKQMAGRQAAQLLERLQGDPKNGLVLAQLGAIYHVAHQYDQAAVFYERAVELDPGNVGVRTRLASSLYRGGDADGAIAELNRALRYDPNNANALFDLGVIRFEGKRDRKGALAAWRRLLQSNPQLSAERKSTVEELMAEASTMRVDRGPNR